MACFECTVIKEETAGVIKELEEGSVQVAMVTGDNVYTGICVAKEAGIINPNKVVLLAKMTGDNAIGWVNADSDETVKDPSEDLLRDANSNIDLAVTSKAWKEFLKADPKYAAMIAKHIKVFGRCNPSDKVSVERLILDLLNENTCQLDLTHILFSRFHF
jgi:magnesium-transporting ATPase (P-type)